MFSLFIAVLIYLIQVGYSHFSIYGALASSAKFVFYWNAVFASITAFFFLLLIAGLSTILFKVPFIGVGIYRFNEQIRQLGLVQFLLKTSFLWFLSRSFILIGSYFLAFEMSESMDITIASLVVVFLGYVIKKRTSYEKGTRIHHHVSLQNFDLKKPYEKDITPTKNLEEK